LCSALFLSVFAVFPNSKCNWIILDDEKNKSSLLAALYGCTLFVNIENTILFTKYITCALVLKNCNEFLERRKEWL
jgi:hypothetical protein